MAKGLRIASKMRKVHASISVKRACVVVPRATVPDRAYSADSQSRSRKTDLAFAGSA